MADGKALSAEDVLLLITENNKTLVEGFKEFAKELKKPNEFEQQKLDKEQQLLRNKRAEALRLGAAQEQNKLMKMLSCPHQRPDGQHTWTGQALSNNTFVPTCCQCWSQLPKIPVTMQQVQNGINLNTYKGLNAESLMGWHKKSFGGDCKDPDCVACHPEKLNKMRDSLREQYLKAQQQATTLAV